MPRKQKDETMEQEYFYDLVLEVFKLTTPTERSIVAREWCAEPGRSFPMFEDRGLVPVALVVAALVDVEHPFLVNENGKLRAATLTGCAVQVLGYEARNPRVPIDYPGDLPDADRQKLYTGDVYKPDFVHTPPAPAPA